MEAIIIAAVQWIVILGYVLLRSRSARATLYGDRLSK